MESREAQIAGLAIGASFNAKHQYQNLMYVTAGYMEGHVPGTSWAHFVESRIFDPLGMTSSSPITTIHWPSFAGTGVLSRFERPMCESSPGQRSRFAAGCATRTEAAYVPHPGTHPSHDLTAYTGEYSHPAFGLVRMELYHDGLKTFLPGSLFDMVQGRPLEPAVSPMVFVKVR